jgi:hypothetical protein
LSPCSGSETDCKASPFCTDRGALRLNGELFTSSAAIAAYSKKTFDSSTQKRQSLFGRGCREGENMKEALMTRTHKEHLWDIVISALFLVPAYFLFRESTSGDASIYFTFIKNFLHLPFSFHPSTVSFGATSPLHVLLHAPVHALLGEHWFLGSQLLSFMLIPLGISFLNRAIRGGRTTVMILSTLTLLTRPLLITTCQFYESSLVFLCISIIYFCLKQRRWWYAMLGAGLLYLVRPELILITIAVDAYVFFASRQPVKWVLIGLVSCFPALIYHAYMFSHTGQLLPSSVVGRGLRAVEGTGSWFERCSLFFSPLLTRDGLTYLLGLMSLLALGFRDFRRYAVEILIFLPIPILFVAVPAHGHTQRYLLPVIPIAIVCTTTAVRAGWIWICTKAPQVLRQHAPDMVRKCNLRTLATLTILGAVGVYGIYMEGGKGTRAKYGHDWLLLKDLSAQLNGIADPEDKVIIYEIQAQYYLAAHCISLDCIVGQDMLGVYQGKETVADFIRRNDVRYVVTMNSFNYRRLFKNTILVDIYVHDLTSGMGDSFTSDGVVFTKVLTNPAFSNPCWYKFRTWNKLNIGNELRVYNESQPLWTDLHPMWNSVYQVNPI